MARLTGGCCQTTSSASTPSGSPIAAHVAQLADGPTVSDYSLSDTRLMVLSDDMVLLAYRGRVPPPG